MLEDGPRGNWFTRTLPIARTHELKDYDSKVSSFNLILLYIHFQLLILLPSRSMFRLGIQYIVAPRPRPISRNILADLYSSLTLNRKTPLKGKATAPDRTQNLPPSSFRIMLEAGPRGNWFTRALPMVRTHGPKD